MRKIFRNYVPIADSLAALLSPHAEVVLHDLETDTVAYIVNPISGRKVGDPSETAMDENISLDLDVMGPYPKVSRDLHRMKSTTAVLRDENGAATGLFCVNLDVSRFDAAAEMLQSLIGIPEQADQPSVLFETDWREQINTRIYEFLRERRTSLEAMTRDERTEMIQDLDANGAFSIRNSPTYVSQLLGISRATLYKAMRPTRDKSNDLGSGL
ncbi:PAS domain-containing protein [Sulfitobacter sp. G21635-S1]|uniref:helix-turn-helix transcriptional regulator n=1 Tax=Sulfitobacter sp. G21635-S1 TaxID=3014043 RepID=UPI0022B016E0|nr:PAS domain-containing protein [Sulfitobacter sp. G21635-S1]MCZ4255472.1 PAS domain-containing protein [Sulfitobacter sp. G21635-S1]